MVAPIFWQGPIVTEYPTILFVGIANDGVTNPLVGFIAALAHVPPVGFTVMVNGAALLQNGGAGVICGTIVFVTGILSVLVEGHTVGLGLDVVL